MSSASSTDFGIGKKRNDSRTRSRPVIATKYEIKEADEKEEITTPCGPNLSRFKSPNLSNRSSPTRPRSPVHVYDTYTVEGDKDMFKSPQGEIGKIKLDGRSKNMSPFHAYGGPANLSTTRFKKRQNHTNVVSAERIRKKLISEEEKKYRKTTERYYINEKNRPSSLYGSIDSLARDTNHSTERTKTAKMNQITSKAPISSRLDIKAA